MPTESQLQAIFNAFDTSGDGFISSDELQAALKKGGKKLSAEQVATILAEADTNKDGQISFEEYKTIFERSPDAKSVLGPLVDVTGVVVDGLGKAAVGLWNPLSRAGSSVGDLIGKALDWRDTNVAAIGSDEDKAARKQAAIAEEAWHGCGMAPGVEVWRIEKFRVVPWPSKDFGKFYDGDSYIVLHTYKESAMSSKLLHNIHFWLGSNTSQDEMGTAAYKTVELDDLFDGEPIQYREVMMNESAAFKALFESISYLKGGISSGFKRVESGASISRLMQVKKIGKVKNVIEVPATSDSLNDGDAFVLDAGAKIYCWYGESCSAFEKMEANLLAERLEAGRHGGAKATTKIDDGFWSALGGEGPIKSKEEAGEILPKVEPPGEGVLYRLSDAAGSLNVAEVGRGDLKRSMLTSDDVFMCDLAPGPEVIIWVGAKASQKERASAMSTAVEYLKACGRPVTTSVTMLKEGQESRFKPFKKIFD